MSLKIESRFSPSIVRAAHIVEAMVALSTVPMDSPLRRKAHDCFMNMVDDYKRITGGVFMLNKQIGYEVEDCLKEMRADRKRKAEQRRLARERREAERQAALELIAA